ncbi:MAG TPA: DUF4395 domain-containing protein [Spirochaetia bacterium]|nr:DUF4395 domain-containing protein [Spirochaetia bacterium]
MDTSTASSRFPLKVSEPVVRAIALEVFVLAGITVLTASLWPALILAVDFALRSIVNPGLSPLRLVARQGLVPLFHAKDRPVFYSPKRFAALIGLTLSLLALAGSLFGARELTVAAAGVLTLFSFLEAAFGFCAGCRIYGFLMRSGVIPIEWCPECVNL